MASIYSRSYITLAATVSPNANGGLYTGRTSTTSILNQPFSGRVKEFPDVFTRPSIEHYLFANGHLLLMRRAWAFQERILSPRMVHFADEELYWECTATVTCECAGYKPRRSRGFHKSGNSKWLTNDPPAASTTRQAWYGLRDDWYRIIEEYSQLRLTFQTDVFPALQGIAKRMQATRNCSYYAGIWEDSIAESLLWHYSILYQSRPQPSTYRAPTWSWASRTVSMGYIEWFWEGRSFNPATSVMSISTKLVGDDPTGEISAGELVLRSKCRRATVGRYGWLHHYRIVFPQDGDSTELWMDTELTQSAEVVLLLIGNFESSKLFLSREYSLVLRLVDDAPKACNELTYERVGVCRKSLPHESSIFHNVEELTVRII
jgi:hypothetical protein